MVPISAPLPPIVPISAPLPPIVPISAPSSSSIAQTITSVPDLAREVPSSSQIQGAQNRKNKNKSRLRHLSQTRDRVTINMEDDVPPSTGPERKDKRIFYKGEGGKDQWRARIEKVRPDQMRKRSTRKAAIKARQKIKKESSDEDDHEFCDKCASRRGLIEKVCDICGKTAYLCKRHKKSVCDH